MGSRVEMNGGGVDSHQHHRQGDEDVHAAPHSMQQENREGHRNYDTRKEHDSLEPGVAMEQREDNFGQPFEGAPFLAGPREGEKVASRDAVVGDDVITDANMRTHIAVLQQRVPSISAGDK